MRILGVGFNGNMTEALFNLAGTAAGLDKLETIYCQQVGERPPKNSGELVEFIAHHYIRYPEDIAKDFPEYRN